MPPATKAAVASHRWSSLSGTRQACPTRPTSSIVPLPVIRTLSACVVGPPPRPTSRSPPESVRRASNRAIGAHRQLRAEPPPARDERGIHSDERSLRTPRSGDGRWHYRLDEVRPVLGRGPAERVGQALG